MTADRLDRGIADVVLDLAGILGGDVGVHPQRDQKTGQDGVALVDLLGDRQTLIGQGDGTVTGNRDQPPLAKHTDGAADRGLGVPHVLADVDRTDKPRPARKQQNGFQIHLTRFLQIHGGLLRHFSFDTIIPYWAGKCKCFSAEVDGPAIFTQKRGKENSASP